MHLKCSFQIPLWIPPMQWIMYIGVLYWIIPCQNFIFRAPHISLHIMEDTRNGTNLSKHITEESIAINMHPDFKAIRRSAYLIDNKNFILSTKMDLWDLILSLVCKDTRMQCIINYKTSTGFRVAKALKCSVGYTHSQVTFHHQLTMKTVIFS